MLLSENINALMEEAQISNIQLGKEIGVSDVMVGQWRKGKSIPALDKAAKLAEYFNVSLDELIGKPLNTERMITLPLVGIISAGFFDILNEEEWSDERSVSARMLSGRPRKECVALEVSGDSMSPYLLPGDILIVHRQPYAVNGNIIVAYDPIINGYTVKQYQQKDDSVILKPYNPEYEPMRYTNPEEQELQIFGVCVGMERKLV